MNSLLQSCSVQFFSRSQVFEPKETLGFVELRACHRRGRGPFARLDLMMHQVLVPVIPNHVSDPKGTRRFKDVLHPVASQQREPSR